ncbi:MAG: META domain-containing protein [Actinomycetota bacterium]|nr:META domain-containing protein [Actinomycetota bacterium]
MRTALGAALLVALAGCSTPAADETVTLDGTSWRLTQMQSMDDAQGTTAVPEGQQYTVEFGPREDGVGQAGFQIDCNRGSSTWQATAAESDSSGQLTFGPIAVTLMACPEGSLDQKVSSALGDVRTYLVADGRLHMSLFADGGILTWAPLD